MSLKVIDRRAVIDWDAYRQSVLDSTDVDMFELYEAQQKRIKHLEDNPEEWFKYYFPKFAYAEPAGFHKASTKRILKAKRWFEVRAWSRELAKSTRAMMEFLFMVLTKKRWNILLISNSYDNAERLLTPYKINLESNKRIIRDYGEQKSFGQWETGEFVTRSGVAFRAIGAGQSPRGSRNNEKRIDVILIDDFDTDVDCKNKRIVKDKFEWLEQAVFPTVSVSGEYTILFLGNVISKYCCITEAAKKAHHFEKINIRDEHGKSSWPQKNSEADIDDILSLISYISQQKEFYNNPITAGTVFTEMHYKKLRPIKEYPFLVCYIDPSYKDTKKNDYKAAVLMGKYKDEYHVLKCFVQQCTTRKLVEGVADILKFVDGETAVYVLMELVFLQDIIMKEFYESAAELGISISLGGDDRKKPEKFTRIESTLQPLNSNGKLWLNEDEFTNPNMATLDEQFVALEPGSKTHDDAPDATEGGKWIIDFKMTYTANKAYAGKANTLKNKYRY